MNKEATENWKERFAAELLAIRLRVAADKLLAADQAFTPRVRSGRKEACKPKVAMSAKRVSKYSTDASFAKSFRQWWVTQTQFRRQADLASTLKVDGETLSTWLNSRKFPRGRFCDKLCAITGLECFSPAGRKAARREHRAKKVRR
jgi:hypothetical protein